MDKIWIEKYRPSDFSEIKGQEDTVKRIQSFVESKNMPHLLFAGPAGIGKTSLSLVIAKKLFGENWRQNFLELNASDERGIDVVRNQVKEFARMRAIGDVPFKIIYLDECDALTREAQQALRRTMENFSRTCRFILSCNYVSKVLDPIQSRCAVFKFKPLSKDNITAIIQNVAKHEALTINQEAIDAIFEVSEGDARKAENILQACAATSKTVTKDSIYTTASTAKPEELKSILNSALNGSFVKARDDLLNVMLKNGLAGPDIIKHMTKYVWDLNTDDKTKLKIIAACGETEFHIVEGSDPFIQLEALLAKIGILKLP